VCLSILQAAHTFAFLSARQVLIALWTSGRFFQEEIARAATKPTAVALAETLQMAGGGASRTDVMELCAAVLHVKSGCGPDSSACQGAGSSHRPSSAAAHAIS
jgi:hypothetical protein